jgi:two-component system, LytTR family, sensor kinase
MASMPDTTPSPVSARAAILSAAGVWTCYYVLVTARSFIADDSGHIDMLWRRALVTLAGFGVSLLIWLVLRRIDARLLGVRIAAIVLLALPASLAVAWVNERAFSDVDKSYSFLDDSQLRINKDDDGNYIIEVPGRPVVIVPDPHADDVRYYWKGLSEVAIGRYFLLLAWGALFLALANAERVRTAERREAELRRAAKAAELRSLRYQVNPHFLFNTLNSLSSLVLSGRTADAEAMIQTLATFYRTSLTGDPTQDVPLEEEVRLQRLYLEVEAVRFPERLRAVFDIPEELADACVPGLILQPLVENAVKHAVAATMRPVTITIAAQATGNILKLSVGDDGPGRSANGKGCGIGLKNVRDRLAARFDAAMDVTVDAAPPGYRVSLMLPLTRGSC